MKLPDGLPEPDWRDDEYGVALYCGDCLDILPQLPDGCVDAVVSDPPYGIGWVGGMPDTTKSRNTIGKIYDPMAGDDGAIDLSAIFNLNLPITIFGADHLRAQLPDGGAFFVWDKRVTPAMDKLIGRPVEFGWTSCGVTRIFRVIHGAWINDGQPRFQNPGCGHPTQKPLSLIESIISDYHKKHSIIGDFYMGSGTTGVAAVNLGRSFIGVEIEPKYFDIAVKRLRQAIIDRQGGELFAAHDPDKAVGLFTNGDTT